MFHEDVSSTEDEICMPKPEDPDIFCGHCMVECTAPGHNPCLLE